MRRLFNSVIGQVANSVHDAELVKNVIVIKPTRHILRGFFLERTISKDEYYPWAIVIPLFSPAMRNLSLNYSQRIEWEGEGLCRVRIGSDHRTETASFLSKIFEERHAALSKIFSPLDFLRHFPLSDGPARPNVIFEHAVASYLAGNISRAEDMFRSVMKIIHDNPRYDDRYFREIEILAERAIIEIARTPAMFMATVDSLELQNIRNHFPGITICDPAELNQGQKLK